jgi:hypothetical protein
MFLIGVAMFALGAVLFVVPTVADEGLCAFLPCDPLGGSTAFVDAGDGQVGIELGPLTAQDLQQLEVVSGVWPDDDGPVLWRIERTGDVSGDWIGPVIIGQTPAGFTEIVDLEQPLPDRWSVSVSNECYGGTTGAPVAALRRDLVTWESGETESIEEFRELDLGFSPCEPPPSSPNPTLALVGAGLGVVGASVVIVSWGRRRRRVIANRRAP